MTRKLSFIILLFILIPLFITATPAFRNMRTVKQSDRTTLKVYLTGDEYFHYFCTADGKPVVRESNGDFSYAVLSDDGILVSSNVLAHDKEMRVTRELSLLAANEYGGMGQSLKEIALQRRAVSTKGAVPPPSDVSISQTIKPLGEINVPVVLVQFQDVKFTYGKDVIAKNYNGSNFTGLHGKGIGSVRDYFIEQSDSLFRPNFVVLDVVTLANKMAYYGANDSGGDDLRPEEMIVEACKALDGSVDFSLFDNDGDGEVEFVYCIYAGYSESYGASENTIWPHKWTLSATNKMMALDGVKINTYATSGELCYNEETQGSGGPQLDGIGSCCHEFSHCLGLPDFYDTSGRTYANFGMDYWSLMDYGCYNLDGYVPIGYGAYERDFMGWRELQTLTRRGDYALEPLTSGGAGYKVVNDANPNEYYILENRRAEGFDAHIFNSGMLIIHVDYSADVWGKNEVNSNLARQRYTIIPADNKALPYYRSKTDEEYHASLRGDVWPGTSGNSELTDVSTPAAKVYMGGYMGKSIRNISLDGGTVKFSFMKDRLDAPQVLAASEITSDGFTANWSAAEYATAYELQLSKVESVAQGQGDVVTLLMEDFLGLNLSVTDVTDDIDKYTIDRGWMGFNLWSETGVLRIGTETEEAELVTPLLQTSADGNITVTFLAKKYSSKDKNVVLAVRSEFADTGAEGNGTFEIGSEWMEYSYTFSKEGGELNVVFATEGAARICIDDIYVTQESTERETNIGSYTTTALDYTFTGLAKGKYRYRVRALDAAIRSEFSLNADVVVGDGTGIYAPDMADDESVELYTVSGNLVFKGFETDMPPLEKGIYIVRRKHKSEKIVVK